MNIRALKVVSCCALATSLAAPVYAQDTGTTPVEETTAPTGARNTEIVVTAEFRAANLQDTPIAITAVNAEMLEARGQTDVAEVAGQAPNVTLKQQSQYGGSGMVAFIRGVGQTDFNYALEPGVGVYIDDVYFPTLTGSLLDLTDLERVEVLRGPQGTLAGKNSIGGAIKLFTRKPDGSGRGMIQATYGSYNRLEARGFADFGLTKNLFARVAATTKHRDGYVTQLDYGKTHPDSNVPVGPGTSEKLGTLGDIAYSGARLSLRWLPSSDVEINLSGDYTHDRSSSGAGMLRYVSPTAPYATPDGIPYLAGKDGTAIPYDCRFVPTGPYSCDTLTGSGYNPGYITYENFIDSKQPTSQAPFKPLAFNPIQHFNGWGVQGTIDWSLSDQFQIKSISSYRGYDTTWATAVDGSPVPSQQLQQRLDFKSYSQELRLNGSVLDDLLEFTLGGFYFHQDGSLTARVDLNYAGLDFIHGPDKTPATSKAGFLNGTFHITPMWSLSGGVRYSTDKKTYTYRRSNPDGTVPNAPCAFFGNPSLGSPTSIGNDPNCLLIGLNNVSSTFKGNRWDYRLVSDYRFSDAFLAYASVSTGYKGGGVNPRPYFGPDTGECEDLPAGVIRPCNQIKSFDPETITTYEVGFKADLFDRRLRINSAAFFNKYDNIILTLSACPGSPCLLPANVGKADVKGFETEVTAYPFDGLSLDGSLSYLDFQYKDTGSSGVPLDNVTPYTPEWTYSFGVQYDWELDAGTITGRVDGSYQSKIYTEPLNDVLNRIDSYFIANGRLAFTAPDKDWQVALEVKNIFDKYYYLTLYDQHLSSGTVSGQPSLPRTWSVSVRRNF